MRVGGCTHEGAESKRTESAPIESGAEWNKGLRFCCARGGAVQITTTSSSLKIAF